MISPASPTACAVPTSSRCRRSAATTRRMAAMTWWRSSATLLPDYFARLRAEFRRRHGLARQGWPGGGRSFPVWEHDPLAHRRSPPRATCSCRAGGPSASSTCSRGALEAVIDTPLLGPVRFYSVHLDHRVPEERQRQARFLMDRADRLHDRGRRGDGGLRKRLSPSRHAPRSLHAAGRFQHGPGQPRICRDRRQPGHLLRHAAPSPTGPSTRRAFWPKTSGIEAKYTWLEPRDPENQDYWKRLDYGFVWPGLADRLARSWVDLEADGSDHKPVWFAIRIEPGGGPRLPSAIPMR